MLTNAAPDIVTMGGLELAFHANGGSDPQDVTVFELTIPPGCFVPPPHHHVSADEFVYGIAGEFTYTTGTERHVLHPGESAFAPRGTLHQFLNESTATARALVVITPGTIGIDYFREVADLVAVGGPPDRAKMGDIMQRHGLQLA